MFGWDLIYNATENDLKKKEDVIMLLVHFSLIQNGYKCIGLGADKVLTGAEKSSELLPVKWNSSKNYWLRYVRENERYTLQGVPVDDKMVFNLLKESTLTVANTAFCVETSVAAVKGPLETLMPSSEDAVKKIKAELIDPLIVPSNKEASTQTSTTRASAQSVSQPDLTRPAMPNTGRAPEVNPFWTDPERDPRRVGRQDLDPLASGGGMIFNPFDPRRGVPDPGAGVPGGLPGGSVPPGARFDPFAPPDAGRGARPPPDTEDDDP